MKYMVVVEEGSSSWGAYVPDLPGCVAAGESHLDGLKESGESFPPPHSSSELVEIRAA